MLRIAILALVSLLISNEVFASRHLPARIPLSPWSVRSDAQWADFIRRYPDQAAVELTRVDVTYKTWGVINRINLEVNQLPYIPDKIDHWALITIGGGDCEDKALTKRARLAASGVPLGALRLALVRTQSGKGHAILILTTNRGDFVLDNLSDHILPWFKVPYSWVALTATGSSWQAVIP